jgi:transposase
VALRAFEFRLYPSDAQRKRLYQVLNVCRHFYNEAQSKLRVLQRKLARAKKGSKNRRKALKAVQRQHAHITNQREDFVHKLSSSPRSTGITTRRSTF